MFAAATGNNEQGRKKYPLFILPPDDAAKNPKEQRNPNFPLSAASLCQSPQKVPHDHTKDTHKHTQLKRKKAHAAQKHPQHGVDLEKKCQKAKR